MSAEVGLMLDFTSPCGRYKLTFEDNGRVGYAYLKVGNEIVADVWLFNRCEAPTEPEWTDRSKIPFANSKAYVLPGGTLQTPVSPDDVLVEWDDESSETVAYVYICEDLFGVLAPGTKPGYARYAAKDSPLAKVLEVE